MMRFDRITLGRQAKELGFVRDTFEKVCRLADVLSFMESDGLLADSLALKGGTAINLYQGNLCWRSGRRSMNTYKNTWRLPAIRSV